MKTIRLRTTILFLLGLTAATGVEGAGPFGTDTDLPADVTAARPKLLENLVAEEDRTAARRLDGPLQDLLAASLLERTPRVDVRRFKLLGRVPFSEQFLTAGGAAIVDITVVGDIEKVEAQMRTLEGVAVKGVASTPTYGLISAAIESDRLLAVARLPGVRGLHASGAATSRGPLGHRKGESRRHVESATAAPLVTNGEPRGEVSRPAGPRTSVEPGLQAAGAVGNQAEDALDVQLARTVYQNAFDGNGVRVGTISDSVNQVNGRTDTLCGGGDCVGLDESQATGDLPPDSYIAVVQDGPSDSGDEGRAMMELMYDIAPGVSRMGFATAEGGQAVFANNIAELQNAGMDIITDDVWYFLEPFYQDGVIAQAIVNFINHGGIYFSSAGNRGSQSYEAQWRDEDNDGYHDFAPDDDTQQITVLKDSAPRFILQWSQPWGSATTDLMMELRSESGAVWYESFEYNVGGDPADTLVYPAAQSGAINQIAIRVRAGTAEGLTFKYYATRNDVVRMDEYTANAAGAIDPHAGNVQNMAIAAAPFYDRGTAQDYSSRGPHRRFFAADGTSAPLVIDKPDFLSIDDCNTTFFGVDSAEDTDTWPNFGGTSAAAPNAAAVAALMLQAAGGPGSLDQEDVRHIFKTTAIDVGAAGFDTTNGHGRIHALGALAAAIGPETAEAVLYPNQFGFAQVSLDLFDITDVDHIAYSFDEHGPAVVSVQESVSLDPMVVIHRRVLGDLIAADYDSGGDGDDAQATYEANSWTVYHAKVLAEEPFSAGDPYTIVVDGADALPGDLSFDPVTLVATTSQSIGAPGDLDYFRVVVPSVANIGSMHVHQAPVGHDAIILVFDAAGNELARADDYATGAPEDLILGGLAPGEEVIIAVAAYNYSGSGDYTLTVSFLPDNDQCARRIPIGSGVQGFVSTGATTDGPGDCPTNQDIWYLYQAECTGTLTVSLCDSRYDTHLSVYVGGTCPPVEMIACNDDACGLQSEVSVHAAYGNEYLIRVGGYGAYSGTGTLGVSCRTEYDTCEEAATLAVPSVSGGSTHGAGVDDAPTCDVTNNSPGVWYRITGTGHTIAVSTCDAATNFDTKLSVYCGTCGALSCVGGNDDDPACPYNTLRSALSFCSRTGATYDVLVHGYNGAAGDFVLHVEDDGADCAGAVPCGPVRGACCDPEGYCFDDVAEADCVSTPGARFAGQGTLCGVLDTDGDNVMDTCDLCPNEPALAFPDEPDREITCVDGVDNDCDGLTDLADPDCIEDCTYTCGDIEGDQDVDLRDFAIFARCYGVSPAWNAACICCDMNGDHTVDSADAAMFILVMGQGSGNTPPHCP